MGLIRKIIRRFRLNQILGPLYELLLLFDQLDVAEKTNRSSDVVRIRAKMSRIVSTINRILGRSPSAGLRGS